jgi:hypothetical protein
MPPPIQPSSAAPPTITIGKRSISFSTNRLPQTMIGMLTTRPNTTSTRLSLAAAAMPITLSRLITASAMTMVRIAPPRLVAALISWPPSSCGISSFTPIHSSSRPPTIFRNGICSSRSAKKISTTRRPTAPNMPQKIAFLRCRSGRRREASAITTALSPPSRTSIAMICPTAIQNSGEARSINDFRGNGWRSLPSPGGGRDASWQRRWGSAPCAAGQPPDRRSCRGAPPRVASARTALEWRRPPSRHKVEPWTAGPPPRNRAWNARPAAASPRP